MFVTDLLKRHVSSHGLILVMVFNSAIKVAALVSSKNHVFVAKKMKKFH